MPVEYTESGRIKRVQADSILETKLVINEMQSKRQEYEAMQRQLAQDTIRMRANYRQVTGQQQPPLPLALARTRLDRAMQPLQLRKLELERVVANINQCIGQLDGYLAQIMGTGLSQHDLHLHYQPIVQISTGRIRGFEALVRWQRAQQGFTFPAQFIPIAEETGLIVHLDRWVLLEACRQLRAWQQQFPGHADLTVSVNLSGLHLAQPDFVDYIAEVLQQTGLAAPCLRLEVTENTLVHNPEALQSGVERLRALGLRLNIDDFGAGDTSLNDFERLPFGSLVMDRSLVSGLGPEGAGRDMVESVIKLAHRHSMDVVAKGVETELQLAELKALSGEYAQGYLFSRPVDTAAASHLIAHGGQWDGGSPL